MSIVLIFIILIIGLNCIPFLTRYCNPKIERIITNLLLVSTLVYLLIIALQVNGYLLKGFYTFLLIGVLFITTLLIYFSIVRNTKKKIAIVFMITPVLVLCLFTLVFGRTIKEFDLNYKHKAIVTTGGFMACGEHLKITKTKFLIFNKEVVSVPNLCLIGITTIKTIKFNTKEVELSIVHSGKTDTENPYYCKIDIKTD